MSELFMEAFAFPAFDPSVKSYSALPLMSNTTQTKLRPVASAWAITFDSSFATDYDNYVSVRLDRYNYQGQFVAHDITVAMNGRSFAAYSPFGGGIVDSVGLGPGDTYVLQFTKVGTGGPIVLPPGAFTLKLNETGV